MVAKGFTLGACGSSVGIVLLVLVGPVAGVSGSSVGGFCWGDRGWFKLSIGSFSDTVSVSKV